MVQLGMPRVCHFYFAVNITFFWMCSPLSCQPAYLIVVRSSSYLFNFWEVGFYSRSSRPSAQGTSVHGTHLAFHLSRATLRENSGVMPKRSKTKTFLAPQARAQMLPISPVLACWDAMHRSAQKKMPSTVMVLHPVFDQKTPPSLCIPLPMSARAGNRGSRQGK